MNTWFLDRKMVLFSKKEVLTFFLFITLLMLVFTLFFENVGDESVEKNTLAKERMTVDPRVVAHLELEKEVAVVAFFTNASEEDRQELIQRNIFGTVSTSSYVALPVIAGTLNKEGIAQLKKQGVAVEVVPDDAFSVARADSLQLMNGSRVLNKTRGGKGKSVCMLDTGVDETHLELQGSIRAGINVMNQTIGFGDDSVNSHGTHGAGVFHSVAPDASIVPVKVCDAKGQCRLSAVLKGIDYCLQKQQELNISVITASFTDHGKYTSESCPMFLDPLFEELSLKGIISLAASGNDGHKEGISYPACSPWTVAVGASTKEDGLASFTNQGDALDVLAPGESVLSTVRGGSFGMLSGTSVAVHFVAGALLLRQEQVGFEHVYDLRGVLQSTGKDFSGFRRLDVGEFVFAAGKNRVDELVLAKESISAQETIFRTAAAPSIAQIILNTSDGKNRTNVNLTTFVINATDSDVDSVQNITDWRLNGTSIAVLHLPFQTNVTNESVGAITDYSIFGSNATLGNGTAARVPNFTTGKVGGAYSFDGVNDTISIPTTLALNTTGGSITLMFWANAVSWVDNTIVFLKESSGNGEGYGCRVINVAGTKLYCWYVDPAGTESARSFSPPPKNTWHHIAVSFERSLSPIVYVDGEPQSSDLGSGNAIGGSGRMTIGAHSDGTGVFNGSIDELVLFNRTLSHQQLKQIYTAQNSGLSSTVLVTHEVYPGDNWTVAVTPNDNNGNGATVVSDPLIITSGSAPTHTTPILNSTQRRNFTSEELQVYPASVADTDQDSITNITDWRRNGSSIATLNMPFDVEIHANTSGAIRDYSMYNHNGTLGAGKLRYSPLWIPGKVGGAYEFDGVDDYIVIPPSYTLNSTPSGVTLMFWFNAKDWPSDGRRQHMVSENLYNLGENGYGCGSINIAGQHLACWFLKKDGAGIGNYIDAAAPSANDWHHLAMVYDNTTDTVRIYLDGQNQTVNSHGGIPTSGVRGFYIGIKDINNLQNPFNGSIDQVRVYNFTLTSEQINRTYLDENASTHPLRIATSELKINETWTVAVTPVDRFAEGTTRISENLTIIATKNLLPSLSDAILNSTNATNYTSENLTAYFVGVTDGDADTVKNIVDWRKNSTSIQVLNMPFEGGSNSTFTRDYSSYSNNASPVGAGWNSTGGFDGRGAYNFTGSGNRIGFGKVLLNSSQQFAVELWINQRDQLAQQVLVSEIGSESYAGQFQIRTTTSGTVQFLRKTGSNSTIVDQVTSNTTIPTNRWTHIVAVYYGTNLTLFINGTADNATNATNSYSSASALNQTTIGTDHTNALGFNGHIDEVRTYNRSLTHQQVRTFYDNRTNHIVSQELVGGDVWDADVTPNDGTVDGTTVKSNNVSILSLEQKYITITSCSNITSSGSYNLTSNLSAASICIHIQTSNVALDCFGFVLYYSNSSNGIGINLSGTNNVSVQNCDVLPNGTNTGSPSFSYSETNNSIIKNTNANVSGGGIAVRVSKSRNNTFTNVTASTSGTGLDLSSLSVNNTFVNVTIQTNSSWIVSDATSEGNNISNLVFESPEGSIQILSSVAVPASTNVTYKKLNISLNNIFLNSSNISFLNVSARVTLRGLDDSSREILIDVHGNGTFVPCPATKCVLESYSAGVMIFNVTGFSGYTTSVVGANRSTNTPGNASSANDSAQGGYILEMNLTVQSQTNKWQGYWGSVNGNIVLADEFGALFYRWAWNTTNGSGEIFAAENSTINWDGIAVGSAEALKYVGGPGINQSDSANQTFKSLTNVTVINTTLNDVPSTQTYDDLNNSRFEMGIVRSGNDHFLFARIYNKTTNFRGVASNYQLMVPTPAASRTTYFFFMTLR